MTTSTSRTAIRVSPTEGMGGGGGGGVEVGKAKNVLNPHPVHSPLGPKNIYSAHQRFFPRLNNNFLVITQQSFFLAVAIAPAPFLF